MTIFWISILALAVMAYFAFTGKAKIPVFAWVGAGVLALFGDQIVGMFRASGKAAEAETLQTAGPSGLNSCGCRTNQQALVSVGGFLRRRRIYSMSCAAALNEVSRRRAYLAGCQ